MIQSRQDVIDLIKSDAAAMQILRTAESLALPDWWIGAGFVRNRVWDALSGLSVSQVPPRDVDVAYFDPQRLDPAEEQHAEAAAMSALPGVPWEIRNQARMHEQHGDAQYTSTLDAISRWPETATCVAVTLRRGDVHLVTCHGIEDLVHLVVRPSPAFDTPTGRAKVCRRADAKGWLARWDRLQMQV